MFLVTGVTGKVGGATARHLLAHGERVRALVRSREKAADWMDQGVELVDGDWNDTAAIERALDGVDGAFVMLPAVWAPSPDFQEAKGVIANYVEAFTKARVTADRRALVDGREPDQRAGDDHRPVVAGARLSQTDIADRLRARRRVFENFLSGCTSPRATRCPSTQPDQPEIDHGRDERHRCRGGDAADRAGVVGASGHRTGSMVSADEVAAQLGDVMRREVKAFAIPRAEWLAAFEQFGIPKGQTGPAEAMFEAVNAGWMDLGVAGTEYVASTTLPRDVFAAAQKAATA